MTSSDATGGLVLRRSGPAEDAALRALNASAFPDNPKTRADIVRWQWWDNPFGETLVWVWDDGGRIVAQYVAYCVPGVLGSRPATFTVGVDAAVHPDYQGRRLFKPLSRALYDDCNDHGWPLLAYPSNPLAVRGIRSAGWEEVARLRVHVLALDDGFLASRFRLPRATAGLVRRAVFPRRSAGGLTASVVPGPPEGLDDLWLTARAGVPNGIARGAAWWRWRYGEHPDAPYRFLEVRANGRLLGAAVTLRREDFGGTFHFVLELLAAGPAPARAIVRAVAEGAVGVADGAALTAIGGSALDRLAAGSGFRRLPVRLEPKPLFFGVVPHPELVPAPSAVPWSTSWGDLDHF